jgi:hypothetical protein
LENRIDEVKSTAIPGEVWRPTSSEQVQHLSRVEETGNQGDFIGQAYRRLSKMPEEMIQNVKDQLLASPRKLLHRLSQESGLSRST